MKKRLSLITVLFSLFVMPGVASAYCCMNEAICVAVCGLKCCGNNIATPSGSGESNLSSIPLSQLRIEAKNAGRENAQLQSILQSEINRRSAAPAQLKAGATEERYCCWNPAICEAVCGSACCGNNLTTASDSAALGKISVRQLKTEAKKAKSKNADLHKVLQTEIDQRPAPVRRKPARSTQDR